MNETQIREDRTETREDANADLEKWADAINNLLRIIERSERKLGYFQNRVKQAKFMDRPNQRRIRTAGAQVGVHSAQLEGLRSELRQLERLYSGGIHLRETTENELRQIWGWINRPGIRNLLYTARVSFETFLDDWHRWVADGETLPLAIEIRTTGFLIGFILLKRDTDTVNIRFVIIRPDYRARGYGTDALVETVRYAFEVLGTEHVTLEVLDGNGPALTCFENAGFQYLSYTETAGQVYTMGIGRSEWVGDRVVDEQNVTPQLSAPLGLFFDSDE
ncbi:GNAT family N-acetyltransferase [Candidatus Poribacteria bacterium]|nr:GNAT family N-acetyltransferase [Candidatus Poribacteria bacterium]